MNERNIIVKSLIVIFMSILCVAVMNTVAKAETADGHKIVVSLGDSFSSGEGIEKFYDQDKDLKDKVKSQDWLAHRSTESWPGRLKVTGLENDETLADKKDIYWYFEATSGAVTTNMLSTQEKEYDKKDGDKRYKSTDYLPPQLDVFDKLGTNKADYVTLTLGGNDAGFTGVITDAAIQSVDAENVRKSNVVLKTLTDIKYINFSGLQDRINKTWEKFYVSGGIRSDLLRAYKDIAAKAGNQAKIIVAGYPKLLFAEGSGGLFTKDEATIINNAVHNFNIEIEKIVNQCKTDGMKICFVSVEEEFEGREAYSKENKNDECINRLIGLSQSEDLKDSRITNGMGSFVSAYSMHPSDKGAKAYADCVQRKIEQLEADDGESEWSTKNVSSSNERDVVLTLDVSGSMEGTPLEETKKASSNFINTVLENSANVGIISYDSESTILSPFTINEAYMSKTLQNVESGGGTNIEAGLSASYSMLKNSNSKKKIIVLMSDGEPNEGKQGEELIEYANQIKEEGIYIYTLGFFENMSGGKFDAQKLMEEIASEGCHYEVASADDLIFSFGDMADQLNGQKYIYVRIACPVDVSVSYKGEVLNSKADNLSTRAEFGTLTFEEENEDANELVKILRLKEGTDYDIKINGTDKGSMDYTIGYMDSNGKYTDMRRFENISINKKTVIDTVADDSDTSILNVDNDGDGKYDVRYRATENSKGKVVDFNYIYYIAGITAVIVALLMMIITMKIKKRRKRYLA